MFKSVEWQGAPDRRGVLMLVGIAEAVASSLPFVGAISVAETQSHASVIDSQVAEKQCVLGDKVSQTAAVLRDLWVDHIFWVRNVSIATINNNTAAIKAADSKVVANAHLIASAIELFYGATAKEQFFKLLADHYGAVSAYLATTMTGDASDQAAAMQSLTINSEEIAVFLSKATSYLPQDAVNSPLLAHGAHHVRQIQRLQEEDYDSEAKIWKEMKNHVYQIADATADALGRQFEERFEY